MARHPGRLGLSVTTLAPVHEAIGQYAAAVRRVRLTWRSSAEAREAYRQAAARFQQTLSPYLLRRDKREDPEVRMFHEYSGLPLNTYRAETAVTVETADLSTAWRIAICAAESLSVVTHQSSDPVAKRLRLTIGNGHGISALLDQINRDEADDRKQEEQEGIGRGGEQQTDDAYAKDVKRRQRAEWWLRALAQAFSRGDGSLFDHPAILKAVEVIEAETLRGEKVLVFGRFTRPLRALVDLLNAREMLRRVQRQQAWPQAKVHGDPDGTSDTSEWPAVRAAHRQLRSPLALDALDATLRTAYERENYRRERFRGSLIDRIEQGLTSHSESAARTVFHSFKRSVQSGQNGGEPEHRSLMLVARALTELLGNRDAELPSSEHARAF